MQVVKFVFAVQFGHFADLVKEPENPDRSIAWIGPGFLLTEELNQRKRRKWNEKSIFISFDECNACVIK